MSIRDQINSSLINNSNNMTNFITAGNLTSSQANWLRNYDASIKNMMLILAHEIDELKKKR